MAGQVLCRGVLPAVVVVVQGEQQAEALLPLRGKKGGRQPAAAHGHIADVGLGVVGVAGIEHSGGLQHHQLGRLGLKGLPHVIVAGGNGLFRPRQHIGAQAGLLPQKGGRHITVYQRTAEQQHIAAAGVLL